MPCFHQQLAVPMPGRTRHGKTPYKFIGKARSHYTRYQSVAGLKFMPCKQCIGCRLENSRQWATRLLHETKFHNKSCFLTLTYDEKHVPIDGSLNKSHLRTFFNDLRSRLSYYGKEKLKFFAVGEYGDLRGRPHYHAALFGPFGVFEDDSERVEEEQSRSGNRQFSHPDIGSVWPHGSHRFSDLSFESAAYVARYCLKKVSGIAASYHYGSRVPEFSSQSNGLGKGHFEEWRNDIYPSDHVVLPSRGSFMPPPYYDRLLEKADPALFERVKKARREAQEALTPEEFLFHVNERHREGEVRTIVTEQTLKRGIE